MLRWLGRLPSRCPLSAAVSCQTIPSSFSSLSDSFRYASSSSKGRKANAAKKPSAAARLDDAAIDAAVAAALRASVPSPAVVAPPAAPPLSEPAPTTTITDNNNNKSSSASEEIVTNAPRDGLKGIIEPLPKATSEKEKEKEAAAHLLEGHLNEDEFFTTLLRNDPLHPHQPHNNHNDTSHPMLQETALVYNALTGRMTSETSPTMSCLRAIGFGVNEMRHVVVQNPEMINHLAERIRSGTTTLPPKWPVTLAKSLGAVLQNKNISDPAAAIQQMIQVKINSITRSRYASVVSGGAVNPSAAEEAARQQGLLEGHSGDEEELIELNEEQKRIIDMALGGHHMYIGGSAGTGKTVLLRVLARRLQAQRLRVAMTATTGVAGCHIGGSTFHHALGVSSRGDFLRRSILLDYDVIIIDEVSMFPKSLFEEFDRVLREEAGTPDLPFGGVQIILCGDFMQLGCIHEESMISSSLFLKNFVKARLETQVRQSAHPKFAKDLQLMRRGLVPSDLTTTVQQLPAGTMVDSAVNLLPTNKEVHIANEKELARLEGDPLTLTPETGITALQCETTATLLLRTSPTFNEQEFTRHVRSLLQATLDLPRPSLLSLYRVYEDGHAMRVMLPPGESVAWRDAMKERFLEIAGLLNDLDLGATVTEILPNGDGLHTPESEEYLQRLMAKHPIAQPLTLKKGCRVLLRANLTSNLVNGSIGTVVDFVECKQESFPEHLKSESVERCIERYRVFCFTECGMPVPMVPVVQFYSGEKVAVPPWEFTVGGGPSTHYYSLSSVALPLSLAYAFTVHKVQGLTLVGRVHLELSRMWPCEHLLYVAMSRVRNPDQLSMSSFSPNMVVANEDCVRFDNNLRGALAITGKEMADFPVSSWKRCNDTIYHLRRRGSSLRRLLEVATASPSSERAPRSLRVAQASSGRAGLSPEEMSGGRDGGEDALALPHDRLLSSSSSASSSLMSSSSTPVLRQDGSEDVHMEHLASIEQSVLVARRMRKLVRHVERVTKLSDARKRALNKEKKMQAKVGMAVVADCTPATVGEDVGNASAEAALLEDLHTL